jgi:YbbR domain-containing protein
MLEVLVRNWHLKLLSALLACALWVAATSEGVIVQDLTVPVEISLKDGLTLVGTYPTNGEVRLRGPETVLRRIDPLRHEMELLVDLTHATPGERTVHLDGGNLVGLPRGIEVAQITPNRLSLSVDEALTVEIPVEVSFVGEPPPGYFFYGSRAAPETLTIEGPRGLVEALTVMPTDPIRLENRTEPFIERVGAVPNSPEIRVLDTRVISVRVEVDGVPTAVAFDAVPVVLRGQLFEATTTPDDVRVVLSGPPTALEAIATGQILAVVDVSGLAPRLDSYHLSPRIEFVDMPSDDLEHIGIESISSETVEVVLSDRRISL